MPAAQITRREAMTLVATIPPAAALPTIAQSTSADLEKLISIYRGAFNRYDAALRHQEKADATFDRLWERKQLMAPTGVLPNGQACGTRYDLIINTREQILEAIDEAHERALAVHSAPWVSAAVPGHDGVAKKALDGLKSRAIDFLSEAEAALAAVRKESGLEEAEARSKTAREAELEARVDLVNQRSRAAAQG